ncbi:MAG: tetratricopeptide repeat protein [Methylococcales bacterium]|nr:tetratricopeptide repeat protein [Methylococcales bacterium]
MLIIKLMAGLIFVFLAGCASVPETTVSPMKQAADEDSSVLDNDVDKPTAISPDVLYLLMTAEIAGQRNQYGIALEGYLEAAKRVNDPRISERAAKIGLFLKDSDKTDEAVSLWLQKDRNNLTARKIAALSALKGTDKNLAVEHLNVILEHDPAGFEDTLIELTRILQKERKADFLFEVLEELSKQHQDQAVVFFVQALLAGQLKDMPLAIEKVDEALKIQPEWDKALILRAQLAGQTGDLGLARELLENVLQKTPDNDRIRKMLAQILMQTEAFDDAVQLYQNVLERKPDDGESKFAIALIYLQQKKDDEALEYLKELINQPEWDTQASFYIGRIEYKKERYETALVWFDKVTQGPFEYDASMAAVSVLLTQKKFSDAEQRLEVLSVKFPKEQVNTLLLRAEVYNSQKKYQKAFDLLTDALKDNPEHRNLLYTRALIAENLDMLSVLEEDLKEILQKHPDDASALNALGYTLVDRTERYQEAETYLLRAISLKPDEAVIIDSMGWLRYKQGNTVEALKYLRIAYEKQPESEVAAHLAEVLWVTGKRDEARQVFDLAIKKSPDDEYLLKFRQQFLDLNNE